MFHDSSPQVASTGSGDPFNDLQSPQINQVQLKKIGCHLLQKDPEAIDLIRLANRVTKTELRELFPTRRIFACDFYVDGMDRDARIAGGFADKEREIYNIDHHAPHRDMYRFISSGNLAAEFVRANGPITSSDVHVILNHTDCDSILSALILRGYLPPIALFEEAVIAADHTGEENSVADLLQALDVKRDIAFSIRNLALHLMGRNLDNAAKSLLNRRMRGREETRVAIESGRAEISHGEVTFVQLGHNMRNEFLPALLPNAAVIVTADMSGIGGQKNIMRLRLGRAAPPGFTLFDLKLNEEIDPEFGGRWNAGSNKRGGGTIKSVDEYYRSVKLAYQAARAEHT